MNFVEEHMELLQLKYYRTVVEEGSINGAAKKLMMTQWGLAPMAQTTLAINEGGCDTATGKAFTEYFKKSCGL
jgi:hypothetical protein